MSENNPQDQGQRDRWSGIPTGPKEPDWLDKFMASAGQKKEKKTAEPVRVEAPAAPRPAVTSSTERPVDEVKTKTQEKKKPKGLGCGGCAAGLAAVVGGLAVMRGMFIRHQDNLDAQYRKDHPRG